VICLGGDTLAHGGDTRMLIAAVFDNTFAAYPFSDDLPGTVGRVWTVCIWARSPQHFLTVPAQSLQVATGSTYVSMTLKIVTNLS